MSGEPENTYSPFASEQETTIDPDFFKSPGTKKGLIGDLSPAAAKLLPDPTKIGMHEVAQYHGVGFHIFDTPTAQIPFAAIARNKYDQQAAMSANTKLMNNYISNILKTPKTTDPRIAYKLGEYTTESVSKLMDLQQKYPRYWEKMYLSNKGVDAYSAKEVNEIHDELAGISSLADTGNYLPKKMQELEEARKHGNLISTSTVEGLKEINDLYNDLPESSAELSYRFNQAATKIGIGEALSKYLEVVVPKNSEISVMSKAVPLLDENGNTVNKNGKPVMEQQIYGNSPDDPKFQAGVNVLLNKFKASKPDFTKEWDVTDTQLRDGIMALLPEKIHDRNVTENKISIGNKSPKETPLTTGATNFSQWNNDRFSTSNTSLKDVNLPKEVTQHFHPPKVSEGENGAVVFDSKIPQESIKGIENNPQWTVGVLSHSLMANGQPFGSTAAYAQTVKQNAKQPDKMPDGTHNKHSGEEIPNPEVHLGGISMVYGKDADASHEYQPATLLKDINIKGKDLAAEYYTPYYQIKYIVNSYDAYGNLEKKTLYHYVDANEEGVTRGLDDTFFGKSTAEDIEKLTGQ